MSDAYTSLLVLPCGMEVKETGGDMNEALVQLAVWTAAGLEKLRSLIKPDEVTELLPLLGITVVGHEWRIHLSWKILSSGETVRSIYGLEQKLLANIHSSLWDHTHYWQAVRQAMPAFSVFDVFSATSKRISVNAIGRGMKARSCDHCVRLKQKSVKTFHRALGTLLNNKVRWIWLMCRR